MGVRVRHKKSVFRTIVPEGGLGTIFKSIGTGKLKCLVITWDDLPDRKIALREQEIEFLHPRDYDVA